MIIDLIISTYEKLSLMTENEWEKEKNYFLIL